MTTVGDAIIAAVRTAAPGVPVYDAVVPLRQDGTPLANRYVVVYPDLGDATSESVTGSADSATFRFKVTYVSRADQADRWVVEQMASRVRTGILNARLSADGWYLGPVAPDGTWPVDRDEDDPSALVLYARDGFKILGSRA